jgi:hypothetical protein
MSTYVPDETGLGTIPIVDDVMACSAAARAAAAAGTDPVAARDACMIRRGYQKTAKGYSRHTGVSPKVIVGVVAAAALPFVLPAVLPVVAKLVPAAAKEALNVVKSIAPPAAPAMDTVAPAPVPAPRVLAPAPVTAGAATELPPWLLPVAIGGALVLVFALKR